MQLVNLTEENYILQCAQQYKPAYIHTTDEFAADIKRIKYIKKLLTRYRTNHQIEERLVLNHIIVLHNVFGAPFLCRILYLKLSSYFHFIKPFLVYLNYLSDVIYQVNGEDVDTLPIPMDQYIIDKLRFINKEAKSKLK